MIVTKYVQQIFYLLLLVFLLEIFLFLENFVNFTFISNPLLCLNNDKKML